MRPLLILAAACCLRAQDWADRAEYDMALAVRAQQAPEARLALLDQWRLKYPQSAWRHQRAELVLTTAQALGQTNRMLDAAKEMVGAEATSYTGSYWITVLSPAEPANAQSMQAAETAARRVLGATDGIAAVPEAQKAAVKAMAHRALAWAQWKRGSLDTAERELRAGLALNPQSAELSGWLGTVLISQKADDKKLQAIWHLARGAFLEGDGAMASAGRAEVRALLDAVYANYHGALDGLDQVGARSRTSVDPPGDFKIETAAQVEERRKDEELARLQPELHAWMKIRKRLAGADSDAQFQNLQQGPLPRLKGYVISCAPEKKITEIVIGLQQFNVEEVRLNPDTPPVKCADPGTALLFQGRAKEFTREPFHMTIEVVMADMQGWPPQ